jgi:hypothetical protein
MPGARNVSVLPRSFLQRRSLYIPRVSERRPGESGPGGRNSNADVTVAVFGASGFLGRYVCANNGAFLRYICCKISRGCSISFSFKASCTSSVRYMP